MKRLILCSVLGLGISCTVAAQTNRGISKTSSSDSLQTNNKGQSNQKSKKADKENTQLDSRENYNWDNGQQATPAGDEATGTNSSHSSNKRDSTKKEKK